MSCRLCMVAPAIPSGSSHLRCAGKQCKNGISCKGLRWFENERGLEKRASWPHVHASQSSHLMQRKCAVLGWNAWCKRASFAKACPWKGEVQGGVAVSRIIWVLFGIGLFPTSFSQFSQFSQFSHWLFMAIQSRLLIQAD